jgi:hypothetical protein
MKKRKDSRNQEARETIAGVLTPAEWDEDGRVTAVMLSALDDEEYLIENGEKFLDLLHHNVQASGVVKRDRKRFRTINIKKIVLTGPPVPEEADDGWTIGSRR